MDGTTPAEDEVYAQAVAYCEAIHHSTPDAFVEMCHDSFQMVEIGDDAVKNLWDKPAYLERVAGRDPFPGAPSYRIFSVDVAGGEMARVHLWVDVPPKRYEDHLGFVRVDGGWKLMTKVFRTYERPRQSKDVTNAPNTVLGSSDHSARRSVSLVPETLFYCIGAQKSGTTWLSQYLRKHPQVFVPFIKEFDYFSAKASNTQRQQVKRRLPGLVKRIDLQPEGSIPVDFPFHAITEVCASISVLGGKADYMSFFSSRPEGTRAFGDISPSYATLSSETFLEMRRMHQNAKFIFIMRDPVKRFWSSIRMLWTRDRRAREKYSIEEFFHRHLKNRTGQLYLFSRYDKTIAALEGALHSSRVFYAFYEEIFSSNGQKKLDELCDFLEIDHFPGDLDKRVWETDSTDVKPSDLTDEMIEAARKEFDLAYFCVADRFGDKAPESWLWDTLRLEPSKLAEKGGQA